MASGYGLKGGPSRCYPYWQDLLACYIVNTSNASDAGTVKCVPALEDYYECLHHRKEAKKVHALQAAYRKAEAGLSEEDRGKRMSAGEVRSLGLLEASDEDKGIRKARFLPAMGSNR